MDSTKALKLSFIWILIVVIMFYLIMTLAFCYLLITRDFFSAIIVGIILFSSYWSAGWVIYSVIKSQKKNNQNHYKVRKNNQIKHTKGDKKWAKKVI